jgi:hypothetical protein
VFANNVILSQSERITMSSRPKIPKYARNKNVLEKLKKFKEIVAAIPKKVAEKKKERSR